MFQPLRRMTVENNLEVTYKVALCDLWILRKCTL